jgi:hypothetical protein
LDAHRFLLPAPALLFAELYLSLYTTAQPASPITKIHIYANTFPAKICGCGNGGHNFEFFVWFYFEIRKDFFD